MLKSYSNFTETNHIPLWIVSKDNILIWVRHWGIWWEHTPFSGHMICTSTIKHPTWSTEEYAYKTSLVARFRSPIWLGALHVSHKKLRNPNRSIPIYVGFLSNIFGNHFSTAIVLQNKAWCQALSRCIDLLLICILVLVALHWFLRLLENLFLLEHLLLGLSPIRNRIGSLLIFMGCGTAFLHRGTAARGRCTTVVCAGCSTPILPFLSNYIHS